MTENLVMERQRAQALRKELDQLESKISQVENSCFHNWKQVESVETYTDLEVDLLHPVAHGVHLDYPLMAVEKTRPVWTRICTVCGRSEKTSKLAEKMVKTFVPQF